MSVAALPDFQQALNLGQSGLDAAELAQVHGVICGLVCRESGQTANGCLHHLNALKMVVEPSKAFETVIMELHTATSQQLADEEMGFALWLPEDEETLEDRTMALAQWCAGFLAGIASGGQFDTLSDEAREVIDDLQQIARAELTVQSGADEEEEDEAALVEIIEYVRIVTLLIREEFRGPSSEDAIH